MKFTMRKYIRVFVITSLSAASLVLFQNCSNYGVHLEGTGALNNNVGANHIASTDALPLLDPTGTETNTPPVVNPGTEAPPEPTPAPPSLPPTTTEPPVPPVVEPPPVPPVVTPPVVVNPPPPIVVPPAPPVVTPPPVIQDKPACFVNGGSTPIEDSYGSNITTSDGSIVISSDGRPVTATDGAYVFYGDGQSHTTDSTSTTTQPRINCSYFAQGRDQKEILVLSRDKHNNASIGADYCGVKMIVYDGTEPLRLRSVTANGIHICGNIIIEKIESSNNIELTNVQAQFVRTKGNLNTFKIDSGFRVPVSERKAGKKAKNSYVNSLFQIIPL